jgi:DNA-directed RNA polymerase specialized sigma24 family protein
LYYRPRSQAAIKSNNNKLLAPRIVQSVKIYAQRLNRKLYGSPKIIADIDDIEQDLFCELLRAFKNYDPARSSLETFCRMVLSFRAKNYVRDKLSQKRGRHALMLGSPEEKIPGNNMFEHVLNRLSTQTPSKNRLHSMIR